MMLIERIEGPARLGIWRYGTGPRAMVAFHGWSGDHSVFEPLLGASSAEYSVYSFDLPGSGISAPPSAWTMDGVLEPIIQALDELKVTSYRVLGNCAGALVAMELALRFPERVQGLTLIDPFAFVPWYFKLLTMPWLGPLFYYSSFGNPLGRWLVNGALRGQRAAQTDMTRGFKTVQHDAAYAHLRMLCSLDGIERYAPIQAPVDVIYGARTFGAVRRSVKLLSDMWPSNFRATELFEAGHLPLQEAPAGARAVVFESAPKELESRGARV